MESSHLITGCILYPKACRAAAFDYARDSIQITESIFSLEEVADRPVLMKFGRRLLMLLMNTSKVHLTTVLLLARKMLFVIILPSC
eukprot:scaffold162_cov267-Chaetoceros_neogracile.AAC.24